MVCTYNVDESTVVDIDVTFENKSDIMVAKRSRT